LYGDEGLDDTVKGGMKSEAREASNVRSSSMYYTLPDDPFGDLAMPRQGRRHLQMGYA
jgi:hypothetical protein